MAPLGNDRWAAEVTPDSLGVWQFEIEGWTDQFATWLGGLDKKFAAEVDVSVDRLLGAGLVASASARARGRPARLLKKDAATLGDPTLDLTERLETAFSEDLRTSMDGHPDRSRPTRSERYQI